MKPIKEYRIQALLLCAVMLVAVLLTQRVYVRADMTRQKTYSLSAYTKAVLDSLEGSVRLTWFRSASIDGYIPSLQYAEDILNEYQRISDGRCTVDYKETADMSAQQLQQLGLAARQVERNSGNTKVLQSLYSGLLCEYRGESRVIPFLSDVSTLEADIARFITEMSQDAQGRKADRSVYVALPPGSTDDQYKYVLPWLEYAGFVPILLEPPYPELQPEIPLLVIGSSYFDADMLTAVDVFIGKKGSAVFFVSANMVDIAASWQAVPKKNDDLIELLARCGFVLQHNLVMDPLNFRITLPAADGSYEYINYPFWIQVFSQQADSIPPLLAIGKTMQFFWPSELICTAARGKTPIELLTSSERSVLQNPPYNTDPHGKQLAAADSQNHAAMPLAAFSIGAGNADSSRLLVVADEYCLSTAAEYTNSDANLDFMVNALYWITKQDVLLHLKNKQPAVLPFKYIESDAAFNRIIAVIRILNLVIIPLLIAASGAVMYSLGRKRL